jgi:hypothetical protein
LYLSFTAAIFLIQIQKYGMCLHHTPDYRCAKSISKWHTGGYSNTGGDKEHTCKFGGV